MDSKLNSPFSTPKGKSVYNSACSVIQKFGMKKLIYDGVLVGLSGGADSVLLLHFLLEYRRNNSEFKIVAVHINHMIRGEEAYRDQQFAKELCAYLNVEFISREVDVPDLANQKGLGVEECARDARYSIFNEIISGRNDLSTIAVAHNSTDNAETVVFNMLRGAGARGVCGIPPVRDNVIRPLIAVPKSDIVSLLDDLGISYVTDSTNLSSDYTRNYIRHQILPTFSRLSPSPEDSIFKMSLNLRADDAYLCSIAANFINENRGKISCALLRGLDEAILVRVLKQMASEVGVSLSYVSINVIKSLLSKENFEYTLPGGAKFISEYGLCRIERSKNINIDYNFELKYGKNELLGYDADLYISNEPLDKSSLNVYKISIQVNLRSVIINGRLILRPRADGDKVFYDGMTHKLKKLYNDRKIPPSKRKLVPVLCDDSGVIWIPGFGVRDDGVEAPGTNLYCALGIGKGEDLDEIRMYSAFEFDNQLLELFN